MRIPADQWQILSPLLDQALPLTVEARRAWLLRQTQLDDAARGRLAQLIALADAPESDHLFPSLTLPRGSAPPDLSRISMQHVGALIGPYELLRPLGRGGMAEVWLARRNDGAYTRDIALKLPLTHLPRNVAAERLLRERNVLAALEHPAIARLYDAGVDAYGQPFLAMEYVHGEPIIAYADRLRLNLRARCKLMLQVLNALHYAHQHLVVHRDLKPSNILVRDDGRVTLLDFGIAKVLERPGATSEATELTQVMGTALTLAYAAPEQLLAEPVTTGSDVYSAGVVLFELLTGARPFAAAERSASALLRAMDSTAVPLRIVSGDDGDDDAARAHGCANFAVWARAYRGDLAAICARALRREPAARYPSALSMGNDLTRYFDDRPVQARAGAWAYRWRKFFDRNRVAIGVSTVTGVAALGLGAQAWQKTQDSRVSAARATAVEGVIKSLFSGMNPNSNTPRSFTAKELLDRSRPLMLQAGVGNAQPSSQTTLMMAKLYLDIGAFDDATRLLQQEISDARAASDLRRELWAQCLMADVDLDQDHNQAAYDRMRDARQRWLPSAQKANLLTAEIDYRLGTAALFLQMNDEATQRLSDASALLKKLPEAATDEATELAANVLIKQGTMARKRGDLVAAATLFSNAQARLQNRSGMQLTKDALAIETLPVTIATGRYAEAIAPAEKLLAQFATRVDAGNPYPIAVANYYAIALMRTGRLSEASRQIELILGNAAENDTGARTQARISEAQLALYAGDAARAETLLKDLIADKRMRIAPVIEQSVRRHLAHSLLNQGRTDDALALLKSVASEQRLLINEKPSADIAYTQLLRGAALLRKADIATASAELRDARDALLATRGPDHYATLLAESYLALINRADGAPSEAATALAARVERELRWQQGGTDLADRLRSPKPGTWATLPALL